MYVLKPANNAEQEIKELPMEKIGKIWQENKILLTYNQKYKNKCPWVFTDINKWLNKQTNT